MRDRRLFGLLRTIDGVDVVPWGFGYVCRRQLGYWIAPIPFNLVLSFSVIVCRWLMFEAALPGVHRRQHEDKIHAYRLGYNDGYIACGRHALDLVDRVDVRERLEAAMRERNAENRKAT